MRWLLYGHIWLACAVAAQIAWTDLFLLDAPLLWRYALAAALGTFAGYGTMRLARSRGPEHARYPNLVWYHTNRSLLTALVAVATVAACVLLWPVWPLAWRWLLPAMLFAFFYVTPFTARNGRGIGLRSIPLVKALLISIIWVVITVAVPMRLDHMEHPTFTVVAYACMRLPLVLALCILFDVRDLDTDEPALRTWPQVLGLRGAKVVAMLLLLISLAFETFFLRGSERYAAAWLLLPGYLFALGLVLRARPERDPVYYALFVDGVLVLLPLLVGLGLLL
ncbi:MAG: hypothetical protein QM724_06040 [Flavobacteriales bacterium]